MDRNPAGHWECQRSIEDFSSAKESTWFSIEPEYSSVMPGYEPPLFRSACPIFFKSQIVKQGCRKIVLYP